MKPSETGYSAIFKIAAILGIDPKAVPIFSIRLECPIDGLASWHIGIRAREGQVEQVAELLKDNPTTSSENCEPIVIEPAH